MKQFYQIHEDGTIAERCENFYCKCENYRTETCRLNPTIQNVFVADTNDAPERLAEIAAAVKPCEHYERKEDVAYDIDGNPHSVTELIHLLLK